MDSSSAVPVHAALLPRVPHSLAVSELDLEKFFARRDLHRGLLSGDAVHHRPVGRIAVFAVDAEGDPAESGVRGPSLIDLVKQLHMPLEFGLGRIRLGIEDVQVAPFVVQHPDLL